MRGGGTTSALTLLCQTYIPPDSGTCRKPGYGCGGGSDDGDGIVDGGDLAAVVTLARLRLSVAFVL